jgi:hypothetical protein
MNVKELIEKLDKIPLDHEVRVSHYTASTRTEYPIVSCEESHVSGCGEDEAYCLILFSDNS